MNRGPAIIRWSTLSDSAKARHLQRPSVSSDNVIQAQTREIIERVKAEGDAGIRDFTKQLDGVLLDDFRVKKAEIEQAEAELSADAIRAMDQAIGNVGLFHRAQLPESLSLETQPGVLCERHYHAIDKVGLYVPAGTAPLPSAAIMLAVPARIANCSTIAMCTPPRKDGCADPAVVVAASRAGVDTIYKIGGAQAIAAMAYGTESIARVHKIFGPGNAWVTAAKTLVSTDPDGAAIDMPAGPSEVLIIADDAANPEFVAADLLSQAEHGIDSQVILLTDSARMAHATQAAVNTQLKRLSREEIASQSLQHARIIVVDNLSAAVRLSNRYAPEHLILQTKAPRDLLADVRNAGSVFLGAWTPEAVGDYCSGTNHVLPTYGHARSFSGLGVDSFMRSMSVQEVSKSGLEILEPTVTTLAALEGLDAHANAVTLRLADSP